MTEAQAVQYQLLIMALISWGGTLPLGPHPSFIPFQVPSTHLGIDDVLCGKQQALRHSVLDIIFTFCVSSVPAVYKAWIRHSMGTQDVKSRSVAK